MTEKATITFRFYEELNDFLAPERRKREFAWGCPVGATVKHAIEALGVPHTEVELVLVDGMSVGFDHALAGGERVAAYPVFEAFDVTPLVRVRDGPLRTPRFIADAHLGGLARLLRLAGFDTLFANAWADDEIVRIALAEHRIVLTRDRALLMRRELTHGCYVHAQHGTAQAHEIFERLDLRGSAQPFTRCLVCNSPLQRVDRAAVASRVPPGVLERHDRFAACAGCGRIYWEGLHWKRMSATLDALLADATCPFRHPADGTPGRAVRPIPSCRCRPPR
jgi:uncharacterized protein with PIN domain